MYGHAADLNGVEQWNEAHWQGQSIGRSGQWVGGCYLLLAGFAASHRVQKARAGSYEVLPGPKCV